MLNAFLVFLVRLVVNPLTVFTDILLNFVDIFSAADEQRHALMETIRLYIHNFINLLC